MTNYIKIAALTLALSMPAFFATAQTTPYNAIASSEVTTATQATYALAMLPESKVQETAPATKPTAQVTESNTTATRTMSEELSAWVENKEAVVNSVRGLKRLK